MWSRIAGMFSWGRIAGLTLLAGLLALRVVDPIVVERLRLQAFDLYQRIAPPEDRAFPVAILDVDDRSLAEIGQWPWPRTKIAELVDRAMQAGTVAVAFDIVFSEPDRLSPALIARDNPILPDHLRAEMLKLPSNDTILADSFARARIVTGQTSVRDATQTGVSAHQIRQVPHAIIGPDPTPFLLKFPELVQNLPELEGAAAGRGVFTVIPDPDGIYRRVPVVMMVEGALRLTLTAELLRIATGGDAFAIRSNEAGIDGVVVAGQLIRTQGDGTVWPRFSPSDPGRFVSAADLLNGRVPPGRLAGHLLLVGTSAIGLEDFRPTPLGVSMAGVEIHAQLLENILGGTLLSRDNSATGQELFWIAALSLLVISLAPMMRASWLIVSTLALVAAFATFSYALFLRNGQLIDPTYPVASMVLMVMLMSSTNYLREERRRREIRNAFGQYVSPDLVAQLADHPEALKLGGERRDLSVLFSDVRGFTTLSEGFRDDPQGLTRLMNGFLTVMSNAILEHGGTIDKFMGDAVMAFWNAPLPHPDHPRSACRAAVRMMRAVEKYNRQRRGAAKPGQQVHPIRIGIAVNTGPCFVGNMGSDTRFDYTALGDTVNLASRLEGQSKTYGVPIIVGSTTAEAVKGDFALIELDLIRVKGKTRPERIFALFGERRMAERKRFRALSAQVASMLKAYRAGHWDAAIARLDEIERRASDLRLDLSHYAALFRRRIGRLKTDPPGLGWDGVFDALEK